MLLVRFSLRAFAARLLAGAALLSGAVLPASSPAVQRGEFAAATTVYLVRHAEKAKSAGGNPQDPPLTDAGAARSRRLAHALAASAIEDIYTSQYLRTRLTAEPIAILLKIEPVVLPVSDVSASAAELARTIRSRPGRNALVVGHSNTIPEVIRALGAESAPVIDDADYDDIWVVTLGPEGRATLAHLQYGVPTGPPAGDAASGMPTADPMADPTTDPMRHDLPTTSRVPGIFGEGVISTGEDESHPAFTPDGRELYFLKNTPVFNHWTIVISKRGGRSWNIPEVAPFSGQYSDADPFITDDGKRMYFISTRPVDGKPKQDTDIWMIDRSPGGAWGEPVRPGGDVNSDANEWFPTVADDGTLYFGSERAGGKGRSDIWRCRFTNGAYGPAENLGDSINTPAGEVEPFIAPDERYMIIAAAGRPDSRGAFDLYISRNTGGVWSVPRNLGDSVNSAGWDFSPKVTFDGRELYFTSNRGFADGPLGRRLSYDELVGYLRKPANGLRDIYRVSAEVLGPEALK